MGMVAILLYVAKPFEQTVNKLHVKSDENCSSGFREKDI